MSSAGDSADGGTGPGSGSGGAGSGGARGGGSAKASPPPEWQRLEQAARRLLDEHAAWRRRARDAEKRLQRLEATMRELSVGELDPVAASERAEALERENAELRRRLEQAGERIRRILDRLDFVREGR